MESSELESRLNDFDPQTRASSLAELVSRAESGQIHLPRPDRVANMHCHTFFSFNAYGHSPSSLAWLAKKRGYRLLGIVDFDVLDAVDEFLDACELLELRGSAGIETRVYLPQYSSREINSPGEPGVTYHMGIGFTTGRVPESVAPILDDLCERARKRNLQVMQRVNSYLDPVSIDYEEDVLPLTPAGGVTERHLIVAYLRAAERTVSDLAGFLADKLKLDRGQVEELQQDSPQLQNRIRKSLMKRGGVGYVQPGPDSFPTVETYHRLILGCDALPCVAWLDGTSAGEQEMESLLDLLVSEGAVALNIVPDRNWNISDPELKALKLRELYRVVELAQAWDLPLNVGTEMNSFGQKLVDDFDAPELSPVKEAFLDGAHFVYGHTMMQRTLNMGYQSTWAKRHLPTRRERNRFYIRVGTRLPPGEPGLTQLASTDLRMTPDQVLKQLESDKVYD